MRFELFIAARYLRARRRQAVVGLVTALSVGGITAGVAALVIALSITAGMRRDLQDRLLGAAAHVELTRIAGDGIADWRPLVARLQQVPGVAAAAPALYGQVLLSRGPRSGGTLIKGIVPAEEARVGNLLASVHAGTIDSLTPAPPDTGEPPPLILGHELAETLGAQVGDTVLATSPQGELTPLGMVPRFQRFQVTGIFNSGFYQYDSALALARLADLQRLFSEPDVITTVGFRLHDLNAAPAVARALEAVAGPGFTATTWQAQNRELFRALKLEQAVTVIVLTLIVVIAALNILIALTMMVMEKSRDIAVMMSFGVRAAQVQRIFILQGLLICITGTAFGLVLGYAAAFAGEHFHFIHLDASVYSLDTLPFAPSPWHAAIIAPLSLLLSLLATLYPARSAASVLPAEALRYE